MQRVPQLRATVRDAGGKIVHVWPISPPVSELQPGQSATFNGAETGVPASGTKLDVRFPNAG